MRQTLIRRPSRSARIAQSTALFALVLLIFSAVAFRYRWIEPMTWLTSTLVAALIAALAILLASVGLLSLWREGAKGGMASARALILGALVLSPFVWAGSIAVQLPMLNDVTTALDDPIDYPLGARLDVVEPLTPPLLPDEAALAQQEAYPDLITRTYNLSQRRLDRGIRQAAQTLGWEPLSRAGTPESVDGARYAYLDRTLLLRFEDDIVVRLRGQGREVAVDVRSAGRLGSHDLGGHANRIRAFFETLERTLNAMPDTDE